MGEWTRPLFEVGHWFERKEEVMRKNTYILAIPNTFVPIENPKGHLHRGAL